jgi:hypothetical protein
MRRMLAAATTTAALLCLSGSSAWSVIPTEPATGLHDFGVPGVYGISAWGHYQRSGKQLRVTVCITDTARDVYGGAVAAVAFNGQRHQAVTVIVVGYRHVACDSMTTPYLMRLTADAVSGYANGTIRQHGKVVQVY